MRRTLLIAMTALALLLVGCGTSGGEDATTSSKGDTTAPSGSDGSSSDDETTTTNKPEEPSATVTSAQLEEILPTAADIGPGYTLKESSDDGGTTTTTEPGEEDPTEKAFEEACPKAKELDLMKDDSANEDEVSAEFTTEKDQSIEVSLDPTPGDEVTEENIDQIIEAFNDCGTVSYEDPDTGKITMELAAELLDEVGDFGAKISLDASFQLFGVPVSISFDGYLFMVDGVGVTVTASSGLDPSSFEAVPADTDLLAPLSAEMESRVKSITD